MPSRRLATGAAAVCAVACTVTACGSSTGGPTSATPRTPTGRATSSVTTAPPTSPRTGTASSSASHPSRSTAHGVFDAMSERQRVGQLLMVDCPTSGLGAATVAAIKDDAVGSVILDGTSHAALATIRQLTARLETGNPSPAKLFIATDQEGGEVQRLAGPGFTTIPSGVEQGAIAPATLQQDATTWGAELRAAGVTVDLAPVLDTVPQGGGPNPPIGDLDREYGSTPVAVSAHGVAVARGLAAAGVDATVKHFPGLGRVAGNTDTTSNVTDTMTTADDPYLAPFADAVKAGVPFVMMSTAIYSRIDPGTPAAFSQKIVTGILRQRLGFDGVVISDDIGAARQVGAYSVGQRAVAFVQAGGDMVLTVDATQASAMTQALLAKAGTDPAFKALVDAAALRVLTAKQARGLLG